MNTNISTGVGGRGGVSMINCSREREICNRRTQRWVQQCTICLGFSRLQPSEKKQFSFFFFNFDFFSVCSIGCCQIVLAFVNENEKNETETRENFFFKKPPKKNKKKTQKRESNNKNKMKEYFESPE